MKEASGLADGNRDLRWLDTRELGTASAPVIWNNSTKVSNIDYGVWEYSVDSNGEYTLTDTTTYYMANVTINNGRAYIEDVVLGNRVMVDRDTVFVDTVNSLVYTGYNEVPNVNGAYIAYAMSGNLADVVFILDGDLDDSVYFALESDDSESLTYEGDKYWEFLDAFVDGYAAEMYVSYDAVADLYNTNDPSYAMMKEGVVYEVTETAANGEPTYATELVEHDITHGQTVNEVGNGAFWLTNSQNNTNKYDVNDDTVFVMLEEQYDRNGVPTGDWDVMPADENDMIDLDDAIDETYDTLVEVLEQDGQTAELVYIWKFIPEAHQRDVTIFLDGEIIDTQTNAWNFQTTIIPDPAAVAALDEEVRLGSTLTYYYNTDTTHTYTMATAGLTGYLFTNAPTGYGDLTIYVTSSNDDILKVGNLTLNTMAAYNAPFDGDPGYIYRGADNSIYYNVTIDPLGNTITGVTWDVDVYVNYGDGNNFLAWSAEDVPATPAANTPNAWTASTPNMWSADAVVTVVISDLQVSTDEISDSEGMGAHSTVAEVNAALQSGDVTINGAWDPQDHATNSTVTIPANRTLTINGDFDAKTLGLTVNFTDATSELVVKGEFAANATQKYFGAVKATDLVLNYGSAIETLEFAGDVAVENDLTLQGVLTINIPNTLTVGGNVEDNNASSPIEINVTGHVEVTGNTDTHVNWGVLSPNTLIVEGTVSGKVTLGSTSAVGSAEIGTMAGKLTLLNGTLTIETALNSSTITTTDAVNVTVTLGADCTVSADAAKYFKSESGNAVIGNLGGYTFTATTADKNLKVDAESSDPDAPALELAFLLGAATYKYNDEYVYGSYAVKGNTVDITVGGRDNEGKDVTNRNEDGRATMMDAVARFLGALYRYDTENPVETIVFEDEEYAWVGTTGNTGSNWETDSMSLVKAIFGTKNDGSNRCPESIDLIIDGEEVTINLVFANGITADTKWDAEEAEGSTETSDATAAEEG